MQKFVRGIKIARWAAGIDGGAFNIEKVTGEALTVDLNCLNSEISVYLYDENIPDFFEKLALVIFMDTSRTFATGISFVEVTDEYLYSLGYELENAPTENSFNLSHFNIKKINEATDVLEIGNYVGNEVISNYETMIDYSLRDIYDLFFKYKDFLMSNKIFKNKKKRISEALSSFSGETNFTQMFVV